MRTRVFLHRYRSGSPLRASESVVGGAERERGNAGGIDRHGNDPHAGMQPMTAKTPIRLPPAPLQLSYSMLARLHAGLMTLRPFSVFATRCGLGCLGNEHLQGSVQPGNLQARTVVSSANAADTDAEQGSLVSALMFIKGWVETAPFIDAFFFLQTLSILVPAVP